MPGADHAHPLVKKLDRRAIEHEKREHAKRRAPAEVVHRVVDRERVISRRLATRRCERSGS